MEVNRLASPPKADKMSTAELKKALQKIKQTQLEVLHALKNEYAEPDLNLNESKVRPNNEGSQPGPYLKSISHLNLLKMTEVNNMKKQFERERERFQDKLVTLQQRIKLLEAELELKNRIEAQWNNQRQVLRSRVKELEEAKLGNKIGASENLIKAEVTSYRQQLTEKIKDKLIMESQMSALQARIKEVLEQKEMYKGKYERSLKETFGPQKNKLGKNMKMSQHIDKSKIPFDEMTVEVKKLLQNHQKVYHSLKTRARIAITDLDVEEQVQQSFTKLTTLIESCQKSLLEEKKMSELQDSVIQGVKVFESESFRDQVKRFDKELFELDNLKKEIYELKTEILTLKENKNATEFELLKTKEQLSSFQIKIKAYEDKKDKGITNQYQSLIAELEGEMKKIREQKSMLTNLVKKISQNAFRSNEEEFSTGIKQELTKITDINEKLRLQNEQYKLTIDGLNLTIQNMKFQQAKTCGYFEQKLKEKNKMIEQKDSLEKNCHQKQQALLKNQQKINQLSFIIQNNSKKYETDINLRFGQTNSLRQQIQMNMKQLRSLREVAYNFQLLTAQNQNLKRKLMQVNSSVIHLWEVKEAEYANIYDILAGVKKQ